MTNSTDRTKAPQGSYAFLLVLLMATLVRGGDSPPEPAVRSAVVARLHGLQSLMADYEVEHSYFPPEWARSTTGQKSSGPTLSVKTGTERSTNQFWVLKGNAKWSIRYSDETIALAPKNVIPIIEMTRVHSSAGVLEQMDVRKDKPLGAIELQRSPPQMYTLDMGLGMREGETGGWLTPEMLMEMAVVHLATGDVSFQKKNNVGQTLEFIFDPKLGYAFTGYRRYSHQPPFSVVHEVVASDFKLVGGIALPYLIVRRTIHPNGHVAERWQATVKNYQLNAPGNNLDRYHIAWRKGMTVIDRRTGNVFKITQDGQKLTDETLNRATHRRSATTQPASVSDPVLVKWLTPVSGNKLTGVTESPTSRWRSVWLVIAILSLVIVVAWGIHRHRVRKTDTVGPETSAVKT